MDVDFNHRNMYAFEKKNPHKFANLVLKKFYLNEKAHENGKISHKWMTNQYNLEMCQKPEKKTFFMCRYIVYIDAACIAHTLIFANFNEI